MKRLAIFSVFLMALGLISSGAYADCIPTKCTIVSGNNNLNATSLTVGSANASSCYVCQTSGDYCTAGNIVYKPDFSKFMYCDSSNFLGVTGSSWETYTPEPCPNERPAPSGPNSGELKLWKVDGVKHGETRSDLNAGQSTVAGSSICYYYDCPVGYTLSGNRCVLAGNVVTSKCTENGREYIAGNQVDCMSVAQLRAAGATGAKKVCLAGGQWGECNVSCPSGQVYNGTRCVSSSSSTVPGGGSNNSVQNCVNSRSSAEGKACCYVSTSIATWDGSKCNCRDTSRTFDVASRQCVAGTTAPVLSGPYQCSAQTLAWLREMMVKYNSDTAITGLIRRILEYCTNDANRSQMQFENMITELNVLISRYDQAQADRDREIDVQRATERERQMREARTREVSLATNNINTIVSDLNNLKSGLDVTVWRTEDGSFNTSRLVSDSVAGVVLGTAGGLITSNVIKKNQVKGGFDDISCTVGGQVVAGWGDEFTVGIH